jgi:hypothetical protein
MRLWLALAILALVSCDQPKPGPVYASTTATPPAHVAAPTFSVSLIDVQQHGYSQAPAWFVRVRYQYTGNLPHVVIETTADIGTPTPGGQIYGTRRAVDLSKYEYDVFFNGTAPEHRYIRVYPAEVVGANWHNGMAWLPPQFPTGITPWHLDITWPDVFLHKAAGTVVQSDMTLAVDWDIDVAANTTITVTIP